VDRLRHARRSRPLLDTSSVFAAIQDFYSAKYFQNSLTRRTRKEEHASRHVKKNLSANALKYKAARGSATTVNPNTSKRKIQKTEKLKAEQKAAEWQAVHKPPQA
jgi:endonuclease IV